MSIFRSILDAALESTARASLRLLGRDVNADEDRLLPQDDRDTVINRCHDLRRNNPVASGAALGLADNVVGSRVSLQARTSDPAWNAEAEAWFRGWCRSCVTSGRGNFCDLLRSVVEARLIDGEIFLLPHPSGTVTVVESQRVRPPSASDRLAYRLDADGRVRDWFVADRDERTGEFSASPSGRWVRDVIHCAWRTRPDQVRGWPQFATVANASQDIGEINAANLEKYKLGALAAWTLTGGGQLKGRNGRPNGTPLAQFKSGQIFELEAGQSLQPFVNNQPGGEYAPFVELNMRLVGMSLRLPYEFLLMYFGGASFSSSKAALEQVHVTVGTWQQWLEEQAIRPLMAWRVAKAIADGDLPPAPVDRYGRSEWDRWEWQRPAMMWLDPQAAIQADMLEVRMGVRTLREVAAARGRDLEEVFRERAAEIALQNAVASETGVPVQALSDIQISGQAPVPVASEDKDDDL